MLSYAIEKNHCAYFLYKVVPVNRGLAENFAFNFDYSLRVISGPKVDNFDDLHQGKVTSHKKKNPSGLTVLSYTSTT